MSTAGALVRDCDPLDTRTVYRPACCCWTLGIENEAKFAPGSVFPSKNHWYETGPALWACTLNVAIPPAAHPDRLGLLNGDIQGFPNGRRLTDDVVTIELRAVAGITLPLVDPTFTPDGAANLIEDGTFPPVRQFLNQFPYIGTPYSGYDVPAA